jgi:hypothetical protein
MFMSRQLAASATTSMDYLLVVAITFLAMAQLCVSVSILRDAESHHPIRQVRALLGSFFVYQQTLHSLGFQGDL